MLKIYGLKNCDTCRKALKWLEAEAVEHRFIDLRGAERMTASEIANALEIVGEDKLVNRRGTTWRKLSDADKAKTGQDLVNLIETEPALMKRPIFSIEADYFVGFDATTQQRLRSAHD